MLGVHLPLPHVRQRGHCRQVAGATALVLTLIDLAVACDRPAARSGPKLGLQARVQRQKRQLVAARQLPAPSCPWCAALLPSPQKRATTRSLTPSPPPSPSLSHPPFAGHTFDRQNDVGLHLLALPRGYSYTALPLCKACPPQNFTFPLAAVWLSVSTDRVVGSPVQGAPPFLCA